MRPAEMTLGAGDTTLRLFQTEPELSGRILVLAPHPDDAEIGTFGLYANRNATVVTVTAGNAGSNTYEAVFREDEVAAAYQFKGRLRVIDSITIPWQGGVPPSRAFNLGYFDARLAEMHARRNEIVPEMYGPNTDIGIYRRDNIGTLLSKGSRESRWDNLVEDIEELLDEVNPNVIAAPHPQLDTHRDHQFTTVALAEALERWDEDVTLLLYTNHADGNRYPYGPAGTLVSMPPPLTREVLLDRIYSLPVSAEVQRIKLFALESMHDLRYSPTRQYQLAIGDGRAIEPEKPGPGPDITYLRRGPRSNELFFSYDEETIRPMIQRFLESARPGN
jgi:LmbE family N-acetylglucosaminyl deacetylase